MGNEPCIETEHIHVGICARAGYKIGYADALRAAADLLDSRRSQKGIASRALDPGVAMAVATLRDMVELPDGKPW